MLHLNLLQKYKQDKLVETCKIKHIPIIEMKDIAVTERIAEGPFAGMVCHAQWTQPDGNKVHFHNHLALILECFAVPWHL